MRWLLKAMGELAGAFVDVLKLALLTVLVLTVIYVGAFIVHAAVRMAVAGWELLA